MHSPNCVLAATRCWISRNLQKIPNISICYVLSGDSIFYQSHIHHRRQSTLHLDTIPHYYIHVIS